MAESSNTAPSEDPTEERTEPFSQSELGARFNVPAVQSTPPDDVAGNHHPEIVPLDNLQVEDRHIEEGVRIIVRPLAKLANSRSGSPVSDDSCRWLALRAEVASSEQPEQKVLAVTQTPRDIKFSVNIPADTVDDVDRPHIWCELYYDPASDKVVLLNRSHVPISLVRLSMSAPASPDINDYQVLNPSLPKSLIPGTWRIKVRDIAVLDFRILEKKPVTVYDAQLESDSSDQPNSSGKRALETNEEEAARRVRRRSSGGQSTDDGTVTFMAPKTDPLVFKLPRGSSSTGKELSTANTNALLDTEQGTTVAIPAGCSVDEYHLTKRDPIASTALSAVYTATHSKVPENIVTVKVLKTRMPNPGNRPYIHERNVIRQADMWKREVMTQEGLQHGSIVRYYGGDARFLSHYMEHVDAKDLTVPGRWRQRGDDLFMGTPHDAARILKDIADALRYIHARNLVHNDIKPGNILYSPERGAVLCDFGMTTPTSSPPAGGGTPYYIPPEFIGNKIRGPSSDVWAMGVTMLYVLRKIPLPESRGRPQHPKKLYWQIAGVNNPNLEFRNHGNGEPAVNQMRDWLKEMHDAREQLDRKNRLENLIWSMLMPNHAHRASMSQVLDELSQELTLTAS